MKQYTSGELYDLLSPLPFGSAVLFEREGGREIGIRGFESGRTFLSEPALALATSHGWYSVAQGSSNDRSITPITPISAIKPEGFWMGSSQRSPFTVEGYEYLEGEIERGCAKSDALIVTFPTPESPAQEHLRLAKEKFARLTNWGYHLPLIEEITEHLKKAREAMG